MICIAVGVVEEKNREVEAEKGVTVRKVMKDETRAGAEKGADIEVGVKTEIEINIREAEVEAEKES